MVTFQSIETAEEIEFDAGYDSYYEGEELDRHRSTDYREGFRQAWYEDNRLPDWKDPEGVVIDQQWDAYLCSL